MKKIIILIIYFSSNFNMEQYFQRTSSNFSHQIKKNYQLEVISKLSQQEEYITYDQIEALLGRGQTPIKPWEYLVIQKALSEVDNVKKSQLLNLLCLLYHPSIQFLPSVEAERTCSSGNIIPVNLGSSFELDDTIEDIKEINKECLSLIIKLIVDSPIIKELLLGYLYDSDVKKIFNLLKIVNGKREEMRYAENGEAEELLIKIIISTCDHQNYPKYQEKIANFNTKNSIKPKILALLDGSMTLKYFLEKVFLSEYSVFFLNIKDIQNNILALLKNILHSALFRIEKYPLSNTIENCYLYLQLENEYLALMRRECKQEALKEPIPIRDHSLRIPISSIKNQYIKYIVQSIFNQRKEKKLSKFKKNKLLDIINIIIKNEEVAMDALQSAIINLLHISVFYEILNDPKQLEKEEQIGFEKMLEYREEPENNIDEPLVTIELQEKIMVSEEIIVPSVSSEGTKILQPLQNPKKKPKKINKNNNCEEEKLLLQEVEIFFNNLGSLANLEKKDLKKKKNAKRKAKIKNGMIDTLGYWNMTSSWNMTSRLMKILNEN